MLYMLIAATWKCKSGLNTISTFIRQNISVGKTHSCRPTDRQTDRQTLRAIVTAKCYRISSY